MTYLSVAQRRARADAYDVRAVHPHLRFGTASDRYAGWLGQIYPEELEAEVKTRSRTLGGRRFEERTLPISSVRHFFEHFGVLELDFTFYRPLVEADGTPSPNLFVLQQYATEAPDDAVFFLKTPQQFFAPVLRRSRGGSVTYEDNPDYLNARAYTRRFHEPALDVLGARLGGLIFEQAYQRVDASPDPEHNVATLDAFFREVPNDVQAHLELRSAHLLVPAYFDWLEQRGLGFVFSHWTWLPPIREQWRLCGGRFTAADRQAVARLLTPLDMPYAKAYAQAYPFDRPLPQIVDSAEGRNLILDVTALTYQAEEHGVLLNVFANNRAWGNAPDLARTIAHRVLDEEQRRS